MTDVIIDGEYGTIEEPWSVSATADNKFISRHGTLPAAIKYALEQGYYIEYVDA